MDTRANAIGAFIVQQQYQVTTRNLVLKAKTTMNKLQFIALISKVIGIIPVTQPSSIFNSGGEDNKNGKEFVYCTAVFGTISACFSLVSIKTIDNMNRKYVVLTF